MPGKRVIPIAEPAVHLVRGQRVMLDSHDETIGRLFAAIRDLLQPKKREIGFHVRNGESRYRVRKNGAA